MNFLNDANLTLDYYINKLTLFLRKSYGMTDHIEIFYGFIKQTNITLSDMFEQLDIMNVSFNYYTSEKLEDMYNNPTYDSKILDYLAEIFGASRRFNVQYTVSNVYHNEEVYLTDYEMVLLIRMMIIKNNFNGSFDDVNKFYDSVSFKIYLNTNAISGYVNVYYDTASSYHYTSNIEKMFLAGLFTIESLGIAYQYLTTNVSLTGIWDSTSTSLYWYDEDYNTGGRWA